MERLTYRITDENRRRLEILRAFCILNRENPTYQDLVNMSIQDFFVAVYQKYCEKSNSNDMLLRVMEEMLPNKGA